MNSQHYFFSLILLMLISPQLTGQKTNYELVVQENDEWIMEVTKCDSAYLDQAFGHEASAGVIASRIFSFSHDRDIITLGAKAKFRISKITENTENWSIIFKFWTWTTEDFTGSGLTFSNYQVSKNPNGITWNWNRHNYYLILPTPVKDYLNEMNFDFEHSASENTVIQDQEHMVWRWTYNSSNGTWTRFSFAINNIIAYEINVMQNRLILGYKIPVFIGITGISIVSLAYIFIKRRISYS